MSDKSITNSNPAVKAPALEDNLNIIRKIAWDFAKKYGLDVDDLFQEACLACVRALPKYSPERGAFSTFLWHTATNSIRDLLNKNVNFDKRHQLTEDFSWIDVSDAATPIDEILAEENFRELLAMLSPEAQEICRMVLSKENLYRQSSAGKFRRECYLPTDKPRRSRAIIRQVLEQQGWAKSRIQEAFREITLILGT